MTLARQAFVIQTLDQQDRPKIEEGKNFVVTENSLQMNK